MTAVSMKELLESGVHFGHQTRRWNPRMKPYIFTERGGIYIIDLQKTIRLIDDAYEFVRDLTAGGKQVMFVGTKKQCQDTIAEEATRVGMPFVSRRWLGGLLTNFKTISGRIKRLHELRRLRDEGKLELLHKKEQMNMLNELSKLEVNLGGVADMKKQPQAIFVIDPRREAIVIKEARKLGIPIIGLVDTNCDPDEIDFVIPGNDDAIRSCGLIIRAMAEAVVEGKQMLTERELKAGAEAAAVAAAAAAKAQAAAAAKAAATTVAKDGGKAETEAATKTGSQDGAAGPKAKAQAKSPARPKAKTAPAATPAAPKKPAAAAETAPTATTKKESDTSEVKSGS